MLSSNSSATGSSPTHLADAPARALPSLHELPPSASAHARAQLQAQDKADASLAWSAAVTQDLEARCAGLHPTMCIMMWTLARGALHSQHLPKTSFKVPAAASRWICSNLSMGRCVNASAPGEHPTGERLACVFVYSHEHEVFEHAQVAKVGTEVEVLIVEEGIDVVVVLVLTVV